MSKTLAHLSQIAVSAFSGISFRAEKRGESIVNDYSDELDKDLIYITEQGATPEELTTYKSKYESKLKSWLYSQSNCVSAMIAGPSNFPVRQMQKRNQWADNHFNKFREWRKKVLNSYDNRSKKAKIEEAGGELAIAKNKLVGMEQYQENMKKINAAFRLFKTNPANFEKLNLTEKEKEFIINYQPKVSYEVYPFQRWQFTNNLANIKRLKERIAELEKKEADSKTPEKKFPFKGGFVLINFSADRVQIFHDKKPDRERLEKLRKAAFLWSPTNKCHQRKLTNNAQQAARELMIVE